MKINQKYVKEDLERMIFNEKLSYREIGRKYGVSDTYIKKISKKLGIKLLKRINQPDTWTPHNKGQKKIFMCLNCSNVKSAWSKNSKFCSIKCDREYKVKEYYSFYLENQEKFSKIGTMRFIKPHILNEQNNKCSICNSINQWNDKKLVFVLDHIDGDASNNRRNNLRLICPNCDSQTDTYKSKNKNSARKERYLLNYKN